ncbi:hypothetical protein ACEQ8H_008887 [Pleosporales sp. CAS-2024a]
MAPRTAPANYSFTADSGSDDDDELNALPTPESNAENRAPAKKACGKAAHTKAAVAKKAPAKGGRKALVERSQGNGSDTEEVGHFDDAAAQPAKPAKRGRPAQAQEEALAEEAPAPVKRGRKPAAKQAAPKKAPRATTAARPKRAADEEPGGPVVAETQPETQPEPEDEAMDVEESIEVDETPESMPPPPRPSARRAQPQATRPRQTSTGARRAGSASDSERDPVLRRKVGDLTRKLEAMTVKYDTLREAALAGRESNFEQLKRKTEQAAKGKTALQAHGMWHQDAVIKALRQQITDLQSRTSDLASLKKEVATLSQENARLTCEHKSLTAALTSAQAESKTLSTKLAAARAQPPESTKTVPGSAVKARSNGVVLPGTAEAAKEAQLAKHKVDLYSDLTNLVVLGMKKNDDDEDVYDCLQTGRNGTLHFHLTVGPSTSADSYEDTEFVYQPLLNQQRDRELLDLLPDYLTEEICFPRGQAAKFYTKVVDSMSKKIVLEDEDES